MRALLINPPVHDFACFDYWLKPLGLLYIADYLEKNGIDITLFDFMDRHSPFLSETSASREYSTGNFVREKTVKPDILSTIDRPFYRYGVKQEAFEAFLEDNHFDYGFVTSMMTYWYKGVDEVLSVLKDYSVPSLLGGIYARLLPDHALSLRPDFLYTGSIKGLKDFLNYRTDMTIDRDYSYEDLMPRYDLYRGNTGASILTQTGCPFRCDYCAVPVLNSNVHFFDHDYVLSVLDNLSHLGIEDIALYDDALLYRSEEHFKPLFRRIAQRNYPMRFHFSNGLHVNYIDRETVDIMTSLNIGRIALSIESISADFHREHDNKADMPHIERAIELFKSTDMDPSDIYVYIIAGIPGETLQMIDNAVEFIHEKGVRILMNEFSPVPGTPIYERYSDRLSDPLLTGKTVFGPMFAYSMDEIQSIKNKIKKYNREIDFGSTAD